MYVGSQLNSTFRGHACIQFQMCNMLLTYPECARGLQSHEDSHRSGRVSICAPQSSSTTASAYRTLCPGIALPEPRGPLALAISINVIDWLKAAQQRK